MVLTSESVHIILYKWFPDINTRDLYLTHGLLGNSPLFAIKLVVLPFSFKIIKCDQSNEGEYLPVVLFNILYKVVLTFEPVGELVRV